MNEAQKHVLGAKIKARFGAGLAGKRIALWGLAFKPNTDDMREASSRTLIADLLARRRHGDAPTIRWRAPRRASSSPSTAACASRTPRWARWRVADALAIVTEWREFRSPDFAAVKAKLATPVIFDGRNLYDPAMVKAQGFEYFPIGRRT